MRIRAIQLIAAVAVLFLALPVFAAKRGSSTNSANFSVQEVTTIGQTQLKPGQYLLQAVDGQNELEILQNGKMIGKVSCRWIQLPVKAQESEVLADQGKVTQVDFRGDIQAVQID